MSRPGRRAPSGPTRVPGGERWTALWRRQEKRVALVVEPLSDVPAPFGARRLASVRLRSEGTGKAVDVHGPAPSGFAAFGAGGRTTVLTTDIGGAPDCGRTAYMDRLAAEAGAACHPARERPKQHRLPETQGDELTTSAPPQHRPPHPGSARRAVSARVRERRDDRATTGGRVPGGSEDRRS